ncbi:rsph10b [Symbiodinium necroappetens]|uniref:Rsph10b protein n=1 Tax=Symbiodinium necroappetens TaxID=1628268 RepID=A0A812J0F4_9DINO|nr:rsph10b [Symbiodinium necroappetens]
MSWMWVSKTLAALLLAWSPCAVGGTCPLSGSRASPANILPPNAEPESGSVLMLYKGWNVSNLSIERIEETSGYLSLVFDGPEGGGSLQAGESFSDMDEYVLRRIRISMPSEHTLLNRRLPLEVQLWHEPAVHRDISRLITARAKVQQMLRRFHGLIRDWQFQLKRQEDPSATNASFPNLQTERDWAEAVRRDSIQDGEALMEHASQLRRQIAKIDEEVEVLNERLQRPQSARMVALSLLYAAPHDAVFAASGHFLRWLTLAIKRNEERPQPAKRNKAALQAEVQQLQQRLHEMQAEQKDKLDGRGEERQLQTSHDAQTLQDQHLEEQLRRRLSKCRRRDKIGRNSNSAFSLSASIIRYWEEADLLPICIYGQAAVGELDLTIAQQTCPRLFLMVFQTALTLRADAESEMLLEGRGADREVNAQLAYNNGACFFTDAKGALLTEFVRRQLIFCVLVVDSMLWKHRDRAQVASTAKDDDGSDMPDTEMCRRPKSAPPQKRPSWSPTRRANARLLSQIELLRPGQEQGPAGGVCRSVAVAALQWFWHQAASNGAVLPDWRVPVAIAFETHRQDFRGDLFKLTRDGEWAELTVLAKARFEQTNQGIVLPLLQEGDPLQLRDGKKVVYDVAAATILTARASKQARAANAGTGEWRDTWDTDALEEYEKGVKDQQVMSMSPWPRPLRPFDSRCPTWKTSNLFPLQRLTHSRAVESKRQSE